VNTQTPDFKPLDPGNFEEEFEEAMHDTSSVLPGVLCVIVKILKT